MKAQLAHFKVVDVAKAIAGEFYECGAHDDSFYKQYPNQKYFIQQKHSLFLKEARKIMAMMLAASNVTDTQKEIIADALINDSTLIRGSHDFGSIH